MKKNKIENILTSGHLQTEQDKHIEMMLKGRTVELKALIDNNQIPLNEPQYLNKGTILHFLVRNKNNNDLLRWLLENRRDQLDLNAQDIGKSTPLMFAAYYKNIKAMELLLAHDADPDIINYIEKKAIDILRSQDPILVNGMQSFIDGCKKGQRQPIEPTKKISTSIVDDYPMQELVIEEVLNEAQTKNHIQPFQKISYTIQKFFNLHKPDKQAYAQVPSSQQNESRIKTKIN